jgi:uncharacterized repeat protein (TIGR03803 family)
MPCSSEVARNEVPKSGIAKFGVAVRGAAVVLAVALLAGIAQSEEKVIYSFSDPGGAVAPISNLISDASGNLYGTAFYGGTNGDGMVFELSPSSGVWQMSILHSFNYNGIDGVWPTAGLVFDGAGNLYGTTEFGGIENCGLIGCGTVFELSPAGDGSWTETILHQFDNTDGYEAHAGVVLDAAGNLYGTTATGGASGQGTVYELSPGANHHWTYHMLHDFTGLSDGGIPYGGVILDHAGNLYGMTAQGGGSSANCKYGCGVVFELYAPKGGDRSGTVLHYFGRDDNDGWYPQAGLVFDQAGNLYGTAGQGGANHSGVVFELSPAGNNQWQETLLYTFDCCNDAANPDGDLIFDSAGNLYGVTLDGGGPHNWGTAFELTPGSTQWTETILHDFHLNGFDGANPGTTLLLDGAGNLYGTTSRGGTADEGAVFEIVP